MGTLSEFSVMTAAAGAGHREARRAPWALACGPDVPGISARGTRAHTVPSAWASPELPTPPGASPLPCLPSPAPSSGERAQLPTAPSARAPRTPPQAPRESECARVGEGEETKDAEPRDPRASRIARTLSTVRGSLRKSEALLGAWLEARFLQ